ncbi:MAG: trehalose-phosphatase [Myxococcales bacterium]|nr:trehalose-phosphatase [Myxococcales bacterium]
MTSTFTPSVLAPTRAHLPDGIVALCQRAIGEGWLLGFDFDGTLAPFTLDPDESAVSPTALPYLIRLSRSRGVAVLSGRSVEDLRRRLPSRLTLIGNHGAEGLPSLSATLSHRLKVAHETAAHWRGVLAERLMDTQLRLEDKCLTLAIHWRGHSAPADAARLAHGFATSLTPRPQLMGGDMVLNLLPEGLPDKGQALRHLLDIDNLVGAIYIGDDHTDATVFRCNDPRIHSVQVGNRRLGAPLRLSSRAQVDAMLQVMAAALPPAPEPPVDVVWPFEDEHD